MSVDLDRHFTFSETCYFDMVANTIVDTQDGKVVNHTVISGGELIVLKALIRAYPGSVAKELRLKALPTGSDTAEVRRVISELKKRHSLLNAWIPRAKAGEYRLLDPLLPSQKSHAKPAALSLTQDHACALKSTGICVRPHFVKEARADIFQALDDSFEENHVVFLQGIGGIGKSEAAKHWALQKKKAGLFDTVVFAQLNSENENSNVQSLIADDTVFVISGSFRSRDEEESTDSYFQRKLAKIKQITDEQTLIIIDNYDIDDQKLAELFTGPYRLLVTTRNKQVGYDFPLIPVTEIQEAEHLKEIFFENLGEERDDIDWEDSYIEKLFALVSNHTLSIEIIAKALVNSSDTPETLYQKIGDPEQHTLMRNVDGLVVRNFSEKALTSYECIRRLFNLSRLERDEDFEYKSQVLVFLAAMPTRGIELSLFKKWSNSRIIRAKNSLVQKSWLRQDTVNGAALISMHPLIREIVWHELEPALEKCTDIIEKFSGSGCLYNDDLYHQPKNKKDQYEQVALSLLSAFPVMSLIHYDFHIRIQEILHSCANADMALSVANKLKVLLELENQTVTWRYGFVNYRIGAVFSSIYRERGKGLAYFHVAENLMRSTVHTNEEKMWLTFLYREMANTDCQDQYLFRTHEPIYTETIEMWLSKGEALATQLQKQGFSDANLELYFGTLCVWRSKLEVYRGNLERALNLINTAESEFVRLGYINALDKAAVEDVRALIHGASGEYDKEIECLKASSKVYLSGFSESHRSSIERAIKLATAYQNNGQPKEAIKVLTHYQRIAEEMLGYDAALPVTIRNQLNQLNKQIEQ